MNTRTLILTTIIAFSANANAGNITETKAKEIASKFISASPSTTRSMGELSLNLAMKSTGYYAFNISNNGGFIFVASDDNAGEQILGYADRGNINANNLPANLKAWLGEYDRQIAYAESHSLQLSATRSSDSKKAIEPIVTALWDQEAPYNNMCPKSGTSATYVGCTATAVAQVMYLHKWPKQGKGSISYTTNIDRTSTTINVDFSQSTYNWDAMTDTYTSSSTGESADAVALLMYNVGAASQMQYGKESSGAYLNDAGTGLISYFDYDKSLSYVGREYYTHDEWTDMMYGELENNRAVVYSGYSSGMYGHSFVLDGYKDGYFHINWGWSGISNGYFKLSALAPYSQGAGGTGDEYNYYQEALVGIQPNTNSSIEPAPNMTCGAMTVSKDKTTISSSVYFRPNLSYRGLYSRSLQPGVKIKSAEGDSTYILAETKELTTNSMVTSMKLSLSEFPSKEGNYTVSAIVYDPDTKEYYEPRSQKVSLTGSCYLTATVKGDSISFSSPSTSETSSLKVEDITLPSTIYAGMDFLASAKLTANDGDYYGDVKLRFALNKKKTDSNEVLVDLAEGESDNVTIKATAPQTEGTYEAYFIDDDGNALSDKLTVAIEPEITSKLAFEAKDIRMNNSTEVDPNNVYAEFDVKCTGGTFCDSFTMYVYDENYEYVSSLSSNIVSLVEGDEATIVFSGVLSGLKPSTSYIAYAYANDWIYPISSSSIRFTTAASNGISAIKADGKSSAAKIYTLNGTLVDSSTLESLPKGMYIIKLGGKTMKVAR